MDKYEISVSGYSNIILKNGIPMSLEDIVEELNAKSSTDIAPIDVKLGNIYDLIDGMIKSQLSISTNIDKLSSGCSNDFSTIIKNQDTINSNVLRIFNHLK